MKKRLAIIGCGFLGNIVAKACRDGLLEDYELVAAMSRDHQKARSLTALAGGKACLNLKELLEEKPDYVLEMASVQSIRDMAVPVLRQGCSLVPLSIGAFSDRAFYEEVQAAAREGGAKVHIPSGAVGGFDVLQTISLMAHAEGAQLQAGIETRKGPASLQNTSLYEDALMTEETGRYSAAQPRRPSPCCPPRSMWPWPQHWPVPDRNIPLPGLSAYREWPGMTTS